MDKHAPWKECRNKTIVHTTAEHKLKYQKPVSNPVIGVTRDQHNKLFLVVLTKIMPILKKMNTDQSLMNIQHERKVCRNKTIE